MESFLLIVIVILSTAHIINWFVVKYLKDEIFLWRFNHSKLKETITELRNDCRSPETKCCMNELLNTLVYTEKVIKSFRDLPGGKDAKNH